MLTALGVSGASGSDAQTVYPAAHLVGAWLVAPLAVIALGSGVLLGIGTPWGILRYWWVATKLVITAVQTALVFLVLVPALGSAADAATGATPDLLSDAERTRLAIVPAVASALLAFNVTLAMYKPGRRPQARERRETAGAAR